MNKRLESGVVAALVLVAALTESVSSANDNQATCKELEFGDGTVIRLRSDKILYVNALLEWPSIQVFSVSIVPPSAGSIPGEDRFRTIIIAPRIRTPESNAGMMDKEMVCSKVRDGNTHCERGIDETDLTVSGVFEGNDTGSLPLAMRSIVEYLLRDVLSCQGEITKIP